MPVFLETSPRWGVAFRWPETPWHLSKESDDRKDEKTRRRVEGSKTYEISMPIGCQDACMLYIYPRAQKTITEMVLLPKTISYFNEMVLRHSRSFTVIHVWWFYLAHNHRTNSCNIIQMFFFHKRSVSWPLVMSFFRSCAVFSLDRCHVINGVFQNIKSNNISAWIAWRNAGMWYTIYLVNRFHCVTFVGDEFRLGSAKSFAPGVSSWKACWPSANHTWVQQQDTILAHCLHLSLVHCKSQWCRVDGWAFPQIPAIETTNGSKPT